MVSCVEWRLLNMLVGRTHHLHELGLLLPLHLGVEIERLPCSSFLWLWSSFRLVSYLVKALGLSLRVQVQGALGGLKRLSLLLVWCSSIVSWMVGDGLRSLLFRWIFLTSSVTWELVSLLSLGFRSKVLRVRSSVSFLFELRWIGVDLGLSLGSHFLILRLLEDLSKGLHTPWWLTSLRSLGFRLRPFQWFLPSYTFALLDLSHSDYSSLLTFTILWRSSLRLLSHSLVHLSYG